MQYAYGFDRVSASGGGGGADVLIYMTQMTMTRSSARWVKRNGQALASDMSL